MGFTTKKSLLCRIRDGSAVGWEEFYKTYAPFIRAVGREEWRFCDADLGRLVSDVMLSVYNQGRISYDPAKGGFRVWLRRIVRRRASDIVKEDSRHAAPPDALRILEEDGRDTEGGSLCDADRRWEVLWRRHILKEALDELRASLEPKSYQAFELFALKGQPAKLVAATLGMGEGAVYVCKHRALAMLRERVRGMSDN